MTPRRQVLANVSDSELIEQRREQILRAALDVFLSRGFHAARSSDIAGKAGLTQGTLYNYIRSKGDILYLVCDQAITRYHDAVEAAVADIDDPKRRLARAVRAAVDAQVEHRKHILIVLREGHALDPQSKRLIRERVDSFLDRMKAMVVACAPDAAAGASAALIAEVITYLPTVAAMRRWRLRDELQGPELAAGLCALLFKMLDIDPDAQAPHERQRRKK
jgi:AcrR family transcriptional regulator